MAEHATQIKIGVGIDQNSVRVSSQQMKRIYADIGADARRNARLQNQIAADAAREQARTQTVLTRETEKQNALRAGFVKRAAEQETRTKQAAYNQQKRDIDARAQYEYRAGQTSTRQYIAQLKAEEQAETQSYTRRNRLLKERQKLENPASTSGSSIGRITAGGVALGGVAGIAITGATVAAKRAIDLAADSENALNQLRFVTGATEAQMAKAGDTARELGADINLPRTSSVDAAKAMLEMSKAGFDLQNSMDSARGSLALAAAAETDAGTAAGITASLLKSFGLEGKEAGRVADLLAASANNSLGEIQDVAAATQQASAVFHSAKFTVQDLTTDIALMANAGIKGSDAGTSLKTAIIALTSPTDTARAEMKRLHLELYDGTGKLKAHDEIIRLVSKALTGLSEEQRNAALKTIFGTDAIRAANIVFASGVEKVEAMRAKVEQYGVASETAAAKNKGLKGSIDAFNSTLDSFGEKYGSRFLDPLTKSIGTIGELIGVIDRAIDRQKTLANGAKVKPDESLWLPDNAGRYVRQSILEWDKDQTKQASPRGKGAQARIDVQTFRNAIGKNILFDDDQIGATAAKYGVTAQRNDWTGRYDDAALLAASKAATKVYKDFLESERNARFLVNAQRGDKGELARLSGRNARENNGAFTPTRHVTTAEEEAEAKRRAKERERDAKRAGRAEVSAEKKAEREAVRIEKGSDNAADAWFRFVDNVVRQAEKVKRTLQARADKMNGEADAKLAQAAKEATENTYNVALNSLDNGGQDTAQIQTIAERLRHISKEWLDQEIQRLRHVWEVGTTRQSDDNDATYAARVRRANAGFRVGSEAAQGAYNQRNERTDDAVNKANEHLTRATEKAADAENERARKSIQSLEAFLAAESDTISLRMEAAEKDKDWERWKGAIRDRMRNEIDQNGPALFGALLTGDSSALSASAQAAANIKAAQVRASAGQEEVDKMRRADERSRGRDRFFVDEDGLTRDRRHSTIGQDGKRVYQKVDGAAIDALASMTDAAKERGGDFFRALATGEGGKEALKNIGRFVGEDLGRTAGDFLQRKLIDGPLENLFDKYADKLENALASGGKEAGGNIAGAALLLSSAANIFGKNGKKKQRNTLLGGALGLGLASVLPGVGNLAGLGIGAAFGGMFANGGVPPIGRAVLVGERGPELAMFGERARIVPAEQTAQILRGGGMGGSTTDARQMNVKIDVNQINDRADGDRLFGQFTDALSAWSDMH